MWLEQCYQRKRNELVLPGILDASHTLIQACLTKSDWNSKHGTLPCKNCDNSSDSTRSDFDSCRLGLLYMISCKNYLKGASLESQMCVYGDHIKGKKTQCLGLHNSNGSLLPCWIHWLKQHHKPKTFAMVELSFRSKTNIHGHGSRLFIVSWMNAWSQQVTNQMGYCERPLKGLCFEADAHRVHTRIDPFRIWTVSGSAMFHFANNIKQIRCRVYWDNIWEVIN